MTIMALAGPYKHSQTFLQGARAFEGRNDDLTGFLRAFATS